MAQRDLTDEILLTLKTRVEGIRAYLSSVLTAAGFAALEPDKFPVWVGDVTNTKFPCMMIKIGSKTVEKFAVCTTLETYNVSLDVCIQHPSRKDAIEEQLIIRLASAIQNWLNDKSNRQFLVDGRGFSVWDSFAPSVELGQYANTGTRVARISWWGKVTNPDSGV